jgi:phosphatidylserine/phosphatidylglycerophosphate/cardiolipin synthase-like enzyme
LFDRVRKKLGNNAPERKTTDKKAWSLRSWQGSIIRAIVSTGHPLKWNEIQETTSLGEKELNKALADLRSSGEVYKVETKNEVHAEYQVSDEVFKTYSQLFEEEKTGLIKWINQWKAVRKLDIPLNHEHFFLEGRHLDDFSKELIANARFEILLVNPFIKECDLSDVLRDAKKKGIKVQIITRSPRDKNAEYLKANQEYHSKMMYEGISLVYNEKVHAKLIVVDRAVAIASSMNFYADSSAGVSWEAGLVSTDTNVVESIRNSVRRHAC